MPHKLWNIFSTEIQNLYSHYERVPGRFAPNPVRPLSRFAPNPVRPLSRFAPIPVRPGSFRPYSRSPCFVSPRFINSALKN